MFGLAGGTFFSPNVSSQLTLLTLKKVTAFVLRSALPVGTSANTNKRLHGERKRGVHMTMTRSVSGPFERRLAGQ